MEYNEFLEKIFNGLESLIPECVVEKVCNDGDEECRVLSLRKKNKSYGIAVRADSLYKDYKNGSNCGDILRGVWDAFRRDYDAFDMDSVVELTADVELFKSNVELRLVPEYLVKGNVIKRRYAEDLYIGCYVILARSSETLAGYWVTDDALETVGLYVDDVYNVALGNLVAKTVPVLNSMSSTIGVMLGEHTECSENLLDTSYLDDLESMQSTAPKELYVLTNDTGLSGAIVLAYPELLESIASRAKANIVILPSSVHEVLIMFDYGDEPVDFDALRDMVVEINESDVPLKDVLANNIYYYDRQTMSISIAPRGSDVKQ